MQKIRCVVERITYQNPENGYSVLKCRVKDYSELVPVIGNMIDANVGSVLVCDGNWKVDAKKAAELVNTIRPDIAIPVHYGSIVGKPSDGDVFAENVKSPIKVEFKICF